MSLGPFQILDVEIFMSRAGVEPTRNVFPGMDAMHTFDLQRFFSANRLDWSVRLIERGQAFY